MYNFRLDIDAALNDMIRAKKALDDRYVDYFQSREHATDMMVKLARINAKETNAQQFEAVVRSGMDLLLNITNKWMKLNTFFQGLSTDTDHKLSQELDLFNAGAAASTNPKKKKFILKRITRSAKSFLPAGKAIHAMTKTYNEFSRNFVIPALRDARQILATVNDRALQEENLEKLLVKCKDALKKMTEKGDKERKQNIRQLEQYARVLDAQLNGA